MILSSSTLTAITEKPSIFEDVDFTLGTDDYTFPLADKLRIANYSAKKVGVWIWQASGTWNYDDTNNTTLPIATTDLVADQSDYELPTGLLAVRRVEIKDTAGNWVKLELFDDTEVKTGLDNEESGFPLGYRLVGDSVVLYPKVDSDTVTLSGGIRIHLDRTTNVFDTDDAGSTPGFLADFHDILALMIMSKWCLGKFPDKKALFDQEIAIMKQDLQDVYSKRAKEETPNIHGPYVSYD